MNCLIIFTRYPEPGKTKTRLIPALGAEKAAQLQREMTEHTLKQVQGLPETMQVCIRIYFAGGTIDLMKEWLGSNWIYQTQTTGDLGQRLIEAFSQAFAHSKQRVVIIGIDCPALTPTLLEQAFYKLEDHDLVLGEAQDGGYYLVGLRRPMPQLFQQIAWGTSVVFAQTMAIAQSLGCAIATLPMLRDIDTPEDLPIWEEYVSPSD